MKGQIIPLTKEEMDAIMHLIEQTDEFDFMFFSVLKTTGRRIGELYGIEEMERIGKKVVGKKEVYIDGEPVEVDKVIFKYKKTGKVLFGVKVKDIDFNKGMMKVWVLKRRQYVQDETILVPEAIRLISNYVRKNKLTLDDFLFRKPGRGYRQIENVIKTYAKKAGVKHNVSVHNFRHFFVTQLKIKGWDDTKIRKLTGHKSISSLSSYDHVLALDLKNEVLEDLKSL